MGPCSSTLSWYLRKHDSICEKKVTYLFSFLLKYTKKPDPQLCSSYPTYSSSFFPSHPLERLRGDKCWKSSLTSMGTRWMFLSFPVLPPPIYSSRPLFFIIFDWQPIYPSLSLPKPFRFYLLLLILCQPSDWCLKSPGWVCLRQLSLRDRWAGDKWWIREGNYGLLLSAWKREGVCDQFPSFRELSLCASYTLGPGDTAGSVTVKSSALLDR